jgi:hypothetical protein
MKKIFEKLKGSGLLMFAILLACTLFGITGVEAIHADSGNITYGEPVSLEYAMEHSPEIVLATIDKEVVVIKPHLTPLYTLGANHAKVQSAGSPIIEYDEVETLPMTTTVATAFSTAAQTQAPIDLTNNQLVSINETLVFKGVNGYLADGTTLDGGWFVGYIKDRDTSGKPIIVPINGVKSGAVTNSIPALAAATVVVRGVRTASEKQSRTAPLAVTPTKKNQYMQKSIMETEETTFFTLSQDNALVKWGKTEITDFAIFEHKQSCETDILLGKKRIVKIANKYNQDKVEDTYFQEGLWWQAGRDFSLPTNATRNDLISMMKTIFTGNASSNTKILFNGADVLETINKIEYNQVIYPGKQGQVFGLDVQKIIYGQYTLLICDEPAFNDLGMSNCGLVIDDAYLYQYKHGWRSIQLDNLKNGQSDSQSQVFIDTFGYVLKNAKAHTRIKLV